ncbi:MAG TPA: secretin N-terminal domain-containing protein, partial [Pirellulaceae bacterium]|nr:secretin N-terminal domain-containing protein [Pirellulaceae bacterium]
MVRRNSSSRPSWLLGGFSSLVLLLTALWLLRPEGTKAQQAADTKAPRAGDAAEPADEGDGAVVRAYVLGQDQVEAVAAELRAAFGREPSVKLAADPKSGKLIVVAPPAVQAKIADRVARLAGKPAPANRAAPNAGEVAADEEPLRGAPPAGPAREGVIGSTTRTLRFITGRELEEGLRAVYGRNLEVNTAPDGVESTVSIPSRSAEPSTLRIDRKHQRVTVTGLAEARSSLDRLIAALDRDRRVTTQETEILPVGGGDPERIQRALATLQAALKVDSEAGVNTVALSGRNAAKPDARVAQAGQPAGKPGEAKPAPGKPGDQKPDGKPEGKPMGKPGEDEGDDDGSGLLGSVTIEFLEGLDVMVVRGKKRDVERVTRMIEEIERISVETKPNIQVYALKHANCSALTELITQVYDQILSPRQGRVSITSLVKPNALLLIGRPESVETVIELIQKLDQPVAPSSVLKVFPLRNMAATDAETTVRNFFGTRQGGAGGAGGPIGGAAGALVAGNAGANAGGAAGGANVNTGGLASRISVVSDFHSNSLIVQASPRDLADVAALLKQIDVENTQATTELRIFKLSASLAQEVAPVLQSAIRGTPVAGVPGQAGQGIPQQGAQGGAAGARGQEAPRSTNLQFVTVDSQIKKIVAAGISNDVVITADVPANAIIVRAPARSMDLISAIIEALDKLPDATAQLKVFTIINGDATNMAQMLQQLFGQQVTIGRGGGGLFGAGAAAAAQFGQQQTGGPNAGESILVPLRFAVDARSNSIIASGANADLQVVEALLLRLDEGDIPTRKMAVYRLRNSLADQVAQSITSFLQSQRQVIQQNLIFNQAIGPFEQLEREVIVVAEPLSNSVIISATPKFYEQIEKLIKELDFRPPMVMVQVVIAEVQLNNLYEMGMELGLQDSLMFDRGRAGTTGASNPGFNFNNTNALPNLSAASRNALASQGLLNLGVGRTNGGLILSAASDSVNILLRALQESGRAQVLSRPQVMAIHNRQAQVLVGSKIPRFRGTTLTNTGTAQNIEDVDVGLILNIIPQINDDGVIILNVQAERSALGAASVNIPNPTGGTTALQQIDSTSAVTTISAKDGQTVVFAGLIQDTKTVNNRRVPYLSDIPLLGQLFQYKTENQVRRELMIVMTPKIVESDEDYDWIKAVESERMNWCLADVVNIHGDVGLRGNNCIFCKDSVPVIYPDVDPTGTQGYGEPIPLESPMS